MKKDIFNIPNTITMLRLLLIPLIYISAFYTSYFFFIFIIINIGLTDLLDGYLARKLNMVTEFGKKLDSIVDFIFFISIAIGFYILRPEVIQKQYILLSISLSSYVLMLFVSYLQCKKIVLLHTILFKLSGLLVFLFIIVSYFITSSYFLVVICSFLSIACLEAILIFIKHGCVNPDIKSIFSIHF